MCGRGRGRAGRTATAAPFDPEVPAERGRVDDPAARGSLDLGRFSLDLLHVPLPADADHLGPGDAQGAKPPHRKDPAGVRQRDHFGHRRVDALGKIPQPLPADAAGNRHLAARVEELQQLGDVAVAGPAGRLPRHHAGVGNVARHQRSRLAQQVQDVPAEGIVLLEPSMRARPGWRPAPLLVVRERPRGHLGEVEPEVGHRADVGAHLVEGSVLPQRLGQLRRPVGVAQPCPRDQVGTRCDRRRRVDLEEGQVADDLEQIGRPPRVQQLGTDGDAAGLGLGQPVDGHEQEGTCACPRPDLAGRRRRHNPTSGNSRAFS